MSENREHKLVELVRRDGRYPLEAYAFLQEGLARAARTVYGKKVETEGAHHVTGQQLCQALREEALDRWGMLARTVLEKWNIRSTMDFGNMVYLLIDHDLMQKTEDDSIEDFRDVYDFDEAFGQADVFEDRF